MPSTRLLHALLALLATPLLVGVGCGGGGFQEAAAEEVAWQRDGANPVLVGDSTSITNICDPTVIHDDGIFRLWASCVGTDVSHASVCYAESVDGSTWTTPQIVFAPGPAGAWDDGKVEVPTVLRDSAANADARYKLWYGGASAAAPDLTRIGHAISADGLTWTRVSADESAPLEAGLVLVPGATIGDAGVVSDPTVTLSGGLFRMWYNSFGDQNDLLISHATSSDGMTWTKHAANPVLRPTLAWEAGGPGDISADVSHPCVLLDGGSFTMWYGSFADVETETYSGIARASSPDGVTWTKRPGPEFVPRTTSAGEQIGISTGPAVVLVDGDWHLFYSGADAQARRVINHAVVRGSGTAQAPSTAAPSASLLRGAK